jgi:hypothetical protein
MSDGRPVPALPAKCLDQVPSAEILQPEIIARGSSRIATANVILYSFYIRSRFGVKPNAPVGSIGALQNHLPCPDTAGNRG